MKISTAQQKLIDLLYADPFFTDLTDPENPIVKVPIVFKRLGDVDAIVEEKLANLGVGLIVVFRSAKGVESESFDLAWKVQFALSAVNNPLTQDGEAPLQAEDINEKAAALLNGKPNGVGAETSPGGRFWVDPNAMAPMPMPLASKKTHLNIQVLFINTEISLT